MKRDRPEFKMPSIVHESAIRRYISNIQDLRDLKTVIAFLALLAVSSVPLSGLMISLASLFSSVLGFLFSANSMQWMFLAIFACSIIGVISFGFALYVKRARDNSVINTEWDKKFKIRQAINAAYVRSPSDVCYVWRYVIEPKVPMRSFRWRYSWSGDGEPPVRFFNPLHSASHGREDEGRFLDIDLGREIKPKSLELVEWEMDPGAVNPAPLPYLAFFISARKFAKSNTHLIVKFAADVDVASILYQEFSSYVPRDPFREEFKELDSDRCVRVEISSIFGWRYCIKWIYGNNELMYTGN